MIKRQISGKKFHLYLQELVFFKLFTAVLADKKTQYLLLKLSNTFV